MKIFEDERCLICDGELVLQTGWTQLFMKTTENYLCKICDSKLERIEGDVCKDCHRPFDGLDPKYHDGNKCLDCIRWEKDNEWSGYLQNNLSIYHYNDFIKDVIARYKYRGDYALAKTFAQHFRKKLNEIEWEIVVPIPLSKERLYERGFNQAEALLTEAGLKADNILERIHSEKQSKKTRLERIHLPQVFQLAKGAEIINKKVLLIDDIYTTGSTLRHAAKILKQAGACNVSSLTLARG